MSAPLYPRIEINSGATVTSDMLLSVTLFAVGATEMIVDTSANFQDSSWQPYSTSMKYQAKVDGNIVIYAKFRSQNKETTAIVSDMIKIDTTAPQLFSVDIDGGSDIVRKRNITVTISATGVSEIRVLGDINNPWNDWTTFQKQIAFIITSKEGAKRIYVYARNDAGTQAQYSKEFTYAPLKDIEPPIVTAETGFQINRNIENPDNIVTTSAEVVINMDVTGATFMQISEDSTFRGVEWEAYQNTKLFTLSGSYGTKYVHGKFKDDDGNIATAEAYIYYQKEVEYVRDFAALYAESKDLFSVKIGFNRSVYVDGTEGEGSALNISNYKIYKVDESGKDGDVLEVKSASMYLNSTNIVLLKTVKQSGIKYRLRITNLKETLGIVINADDGTQLFQGTNVLSNPPLPPTIISVTYDKTPLHPMVSWLFNTASEKKGAVLIGKAEEENIFYKVDESSLVTVSNDSGQTLKAYTSFYLEHANLLSKFGEDALSTSGSYEAFQKGRVDFYIRGTDVKLVSVSVSDGLITFASPLTSDVLNYGIFVSYRYKVIQETSTIIETQDEQIAYQVKVYEESKNTLVADSGVVYGYLGFWELPSILKLKRGKTYYIQTRTQDVASRWSPWSSPYRYNIPFKDETKPVPLYAYSVLDKYVYIVFSEALDSTFTDVVENYSISGPSLIDETGKKYFIEGLEVSSAVLLSDQRTISLKTSTQDTITYKMTIYNLKDIAGNAMDVSTLLFLGSSNSSTSPLFLSFARSLSERAIEVVFNKPVRKELGNDYQGSAENVSNYNIDGLKVIDAQLIVETELADGTEIGKRVVLTTSEQADRTYVLSVVNVQDAYQNPIVNKNTIDFLGQSSSAIVDNLCIVYAAALNSTQVEIKFNKQVEAADAENTQNYFILGLLIRNAVLQVDKQTIILDTEEQGSLYYIMKASAIRDLYGYYIDTDNGVAIFRGTSPLDKTGPILENVVAKDNVHIDVIFDEPMDEYSATTIGNYSISKGVSVSSAELLFNRRMVSLITTEQELTEYTLTVSGVKDIAGNTIQEGRRTALFTANLLGYGVDPSMFPAPGVTATANGVWWMVIKPNDTGVMSLSNGDIRFCDFDQLPQLLKRENDWIPVLYFGSSGEFLSVDPASPYSIVASSGDDLQVVNKNDGILTLNQHINDASIHKEKALMFPYVGNVTDLKLQKEALKIVTVSDKKDVIGIRSCVINAAGTALYATSTVKVIDVSDILEGVGIYVNGDGADLVTNRGMINTLSEELVIVCGNKEIENSLMVTASEAEGGAISIVNDNSIATADYSNVILNPIGILGGVDPDLRFGLNGMSRTYIGIIASGEEADLYLEHGTIVSKDLKAGELVVDGIVLTQNGQYAS